MSRTQTTGDLACSNCGACIAPAGLLTCMRCKEPIDIVSINLLGPWPCLKCLEHGEKPKTLAVDGAIQCKFCGHKESIMTDTGVEDREVTSTTLLRESITLALRDVAGRLAKLGWAKGPTSSPLEQERRSLVNIGEMLDLGFDPARFDEILECNVGDISASVARAAGFSYFLYVQTSGIYYVALYVRPAEKNLSVVIRDDQNTLFSYSGIEIEKISYGRRNISIVREPPDIPQITILGKFHGMPVKILLDKHEITLEGGDNLDDELYADGGDNSLFFALPLTTREDKLARHR